MKQQTWEAAQARAEQDFPEHIKSSTEMIQTAKAKLGPDYGNFLHLAAVGNTGVGKSSLINALRGLSGHEPGMHVVPLRTHTNGCSTNIA